jgi:hypothetical protein
MARVGVLAGLMLAVLVLGGCSSALQRVDLGEWHQYLPKDPYTGDDAPRPGKVASAAASAAIAAPAVAAAPPALPRSPVARDLIERAEREEAVARADFRMRANAGKTQEQYGFDDTQDRSLKGASICRSC